MAKMKSLREVEEEDADGPECCAQWSLLLANFALVVVGVILLSTGAWTLTEPAFLESLQPANGSLFTAVGMILVVSSGLLLALSVLGCVAAFLENKRVLGVYYVCTLLIFALLCAAAAVGFVYRHRVENSLRAELSASIVNYDPAQTDAPITSGWDKLQRDYKCCGVKSSSATSAAPPWEAWRKNKRINSGPAHDRVPQSCCLSTGDSGQTADCASARVVDTQLIYQADCFDQAFNYLEGCAQVLCIVCVIFACVLIIAAGLSICLYYLVGA